MSSGRGLARVLSVRSVRWYDVDWHVLGIALVLLGFGLLFVEAMGDSVANRASTAVRFGSHLDKVLITLPLVFVGLCLRPAWLRRHATPLYLATLVLLLLVPWIGEERNNARRWIGLPHFDLQPSELAKVGVILMLARLLARNRLSQARDWIRPAATVMLPMGLVALQPDLGTAMTLVPIALGMFYLAGARARTLLVLVAAGIGTGLVALDAGWLHGYQEKRVETWFGSYDPESLIEQRNRLGFHVYHARLVIGNGGLFGRGLGQGIANETGYLPERDSDSIFAVIAEEAGFVGSSALIGLYGLLVVLLMAAGSQLRDRFARLAVGGVALYFASHVFINVSVNLGLLPMTGLTLPLFSTGGSSLLATFLALGVALGLASQRSTVLDQDAFRTY